MSAHVEEYITISLGFVSRIDGERLLHVSIRCKLCDTWGHAEEILVEHRHDRLPLIALEIESHLYDSHDMNCASDPTAKGRLAAVSRRAGRATPDDIYAGVPFLGPVPHDESAEVA